LADALRRSRGAFGCIGLFSGLINLLMLTGPLFMLQVYDRVLPSGSLPTLVALALLTLCLYAFQGFLDAIRSRVLRRIGSAIDEELCRRSYDAIVRLPLKTRSRDHGLQPVRDLDRIRTFLSSPGPGALFDLPWIPLYVGVCFLFHPLIGLAAAAGAIVLAVLAVMTEFATSTHAKAAVVVSAARDTLLEASRRNAEALQAMGMAPQMAARFVAINDDYLKTQGEVADRSSSLSAFSRVIRLFLQSLVLGLGAYLVIIQEASAGVIIASSILTSRALAPVDLAIANWKGFVAAREARKHLDRLLAILPERPLPLQLPRPEESLAVCGIGATPPGLARRILQDVTFELASGDGLGIVGPSGSGKSTLARLLVGVWEPAGGKIRLDGAALDQWAPEELGRHIGYLPQSVELFDGTVAENIGRFESGAEPGAVIAAAKAAGAHDLVTSLPNGYETSISEAGTSLSAGQRQRIALARALYRDPFLVVLDEPNSNLDTRGEAALTEAIRGVRERGGIAIVIAHRPNVLAALDHVLVIHQGRQLTFGQKDDVLRGIARAPSPPLAVVEAS
jgi:ATP-binding cassette, subfamily C, type I secretion system permease/ATPase